MPHKNIRRRQECARRRYLKNKSKILKQNEASRQRNLAADLKRKKDYWAQMGSYFNRQKAMSKAGKFRELMDKLLPMKIVDDCLKVGGSA